MTEHIPWSAPTSRQLLVGHAAELAGLLRTEIGRLGRDAESFRRQSLPLLAANMVTLRQRLVDLLQLAEDVAKEGRTLTPREDR